LTAKWGEDTRTELVKRVKGIGGKFVRKKGRLNDADLQAHPNPV